MGTFQLEKDVSTFAVHVALWMFVEEPWNLVLKQAPQTASTTTP